MNIAFDPWIPVVTITGEDHLASLCSVLSEGEKYADLAVRPHERVSLMRLFLCVAHAALHGPEDYAAWCEIPKQLPEVVPEYLETWKDSFELFHVEKPWLQVANLNCMPDAKGKNNELLAWSSLSKLCFSRASGNRTTLFDHTAHHGEAKPEYSPEAIALNLLTFQNFFVAGGKATSRIWGEFEMKNPPNPKGGPCSGKSILFTFIRAENLAQTIHLNLNTFDDLKLIYGDDDFLGKPLWEMPIRSPDDYIPIQNATKTHIGRLVPQTRMLRINKDLKTVMLGPGFVYPKYQDENNTFYPDIFSTVILKKEERVLLSARPDSSIWRELHCLITLKKNSMESSRGSICLLNMPEDDDCDIVVNALVTDPQKAADIVDTVESVFHIPSRLRTPEGTAAYEEEVKIGEKLAIRLGDAVEVYREQIDGAWKKRLDSAKSKGALKAMLHSTATTHYWTALEKDLPLLMHHITSIGTANALPTRDIWRKKIFSSACEAYRLACGQETPRQMRAFAKGLEKLIFRKDESVSISLNTMEKKQ